MRGTQFGILTVTLLAGLGVQACKLSHREPGSSSPGPEATAHWVQNAQLRTIMDELQLLAMESWPQELDPEMPKSGLQQRLKAFTEAQRLAAGLAQGAVEISAAVAKAKMSEADRRSFLAQVETFRDQAQRLGEAADAQDPEGMEQLLNAIDETCMSCHGRFRDFSGAIIRS